LAKPLLLSKNPFHINSIRSLRTQAVLLIEVGPKALKCRLSPNCSSPNNSWLLLVQSSNQGKLEYLHAEEFTGMRFEICGISLKEDISGRKTEAK
jgi:hypothetical protein